MKTEEIYVGQVRAALWGGEVQWNAGQTDDLLRLNLVQGTGSLVFPAVLAQDDIPAQAKMQMKAVCMNTYQNHVHLQHTLEQAWTALTKAGIRPVLMKGAGLAALYPEPTLRQWGDIDLFVGKDQYHPACATMRETFPNALKFDEELDHYKHYNLIADGVSIEVHRVTVAMTHPLDVQRYARMESYGMSKNEPLMLNGLEVQVPEPTFNALFVFLHLWEHMLSSGANLRQLCDLTLLLHHYAQAIDRKRLKRWLQALHLNDVWRVCMGILVEALGLSPQEAPGYSEPFADRAERLLTDLLQGRVVAPKASKAAPKNRLLRKWHTMHERLANAKRIERYSPAYARHMTAAILLSGLGRLCAKDRHWE